MSFEAITLRPEDVRWAGAAALIVKRYNEAFGAKFEVVAPEIVALYNRRGEVIGATGIRDFHSGFFSETYLDAPVEQVISARAGKPVARDAIIEVVHLASSRPMVLMMLLDEVVRIGRSRGRTWGLFTASGQIQDILHHAQKPLVTLGEAKASRVKSPEIWGRYYQSRPQVCALEDDPSNQLIFDPRQMPVAERRGIA